MEQSPSWAANRSSAIQGLPRILWNPTVHYRTHKFPPPLHNLSQLDPVHTPTSHFLKIHLILSSHLRLGLSSGLFHSGFPIKTVYTPLLYSHTCYMPHPTHSSRFDHPNNIGWGVQIINLPLYSFLHSPVTSPLLGSNILLSTLFSNTLSLCSSLNTSDQVSHPYKTKGRNRDTDKKYLKLSYDHFLNVIPN